MHLLLRVPSFARWPLTLHFFDKDVHAKWNQHCAAPGLEPLRRTLEVVTDFAPTAVEALMATAETSASLLDHSCSDDDDPAEEESAEEQAGPQWGIHALPLDHYPLATYLEKGQNITAFEREGACVVCRQELDHDKGLYPICSSGECEGVGHLDCWSRHLLHQQEEGTTNSVILPMDGRCPKCDSEVRWGDMMKELTLRTRGHKEIDKILKKHRKATGTTKPRVQSKAAGKRKSPTKVNSPARRKSPPKAKDPGKGKRPDKKTGKTKAAAIAVDDD